MKRTRLVVAAVVIGLSSLFTGIALASGRQEQPAPSLTQGQGLMTACDAMHNTPAMQRMRGQMSPAMRAACDAMHADMSTMMGGSGTGMDAVSSPMSDTPSGLGSADQHHPAAGVTPAGMR